MNQNQLRLVAADKNLARLGDSFVNFVFSLALTRVRGTPHGVKVSNRVLADAARNAGLRSMLPKRLTGGDIANAAEALIAHAWMQTWISLERIVTVLAENVEDPTASFQKLLTEILADSRAEI